MYKRFFKQILPRRFLPVVMLLVQAGVLLYTVLSGSILSQITSAVLGLVSIGTSISIAASSQKGAFKVGWILLILLLPLFGITVYLLFNYQRATRSFANAVERSCREVARFPSPSSRAWPAIWRAGAFRSTEKRTANFCPWGRTPLLPCWRPWSRRSAIFFWSSSSSRRGRCGTPSWRC